MSSFLALVVLLSGCQVVAPPPNSSPPETVFPLVTVRNDDTTVSRSCRLQIPEGQVIDDRNRNGVIQVTGSEIVIEFTEGSLLRGAPPDARPDAFEGYGLRIVGQQGVTIRGARIEGYRAGIWASNTPGLTIENTVVPRNRAAFLKSTPQAEDSSDWLWPHANDKNEWLERYGSAIYIEDSSGVTVRRCRVRGSQNGLCLDRVEDSRIYDNDFSFLSGWGLALWRSSRNVISRNALDFCIRGYSHGVYNRGQDSAGILAFEQCCENVFIENSATHGGDGFFAFAGREALGEAGKHPEAWYRRRGNNDNVLVRNDFSYAAAHGIEITFSFGNKLMENRVVENAICGVWGGYSQDTSILGNIFENNGEMGYGLERGGVNIEHGRNNRIVDNRFRKNKCGVHLWWDPDGALGKTPWARANGTDSVGNVIRANVFDGEPVAFHLRGPSQVVIEGNSLNEVGTRLEKDAESIVEEDAAGVEKLGTELDLPRDIPGETRPVGRRASLRGRANIIMTEWGPWDHEAPLVRLEERGSRSHVYEVRNAPPETRLSVQGDGVKGRELRPESRETRLYRVAVEREGVHPYRFVAQGPSFHREVHATFVNARWSVRFFPWTEATDPREDLAAWRALGGAEKVVSLEVDHIDFPYGSGGPRTLELGSELRERGPGADRFGMVARTELPLKRGKWRFATLSDDGVRVLVDGKPVIENWTWHGPTRDEGVLELESDRRVKIEVEHFEIDGYAVLKFDITPEDG